MHVKKQRCLLENKVKRKYFALLMLALALLFYPQPLFSQTPFQNNKTASAGPMPSKAEGASTSHRIIQILQIPGEATPFSWERDVGFSQKSVRQCKNNNESAEWLDLCHVFQSQSGDLVTLNAQTENGPKSAQISPSVLLDNGSDWVEIVFVSTSSVAFKSSSVIKFSENIPDDLGQFIRISILPATQNAQCHFDAPPAAKTLLVQKVWRLALHDREKSDLLFEQEELPYRMFHAFEKITCQIVLFDGVLFKKIEATQRSDSLGLNPGRNLNVVSVSKDDVTTLDLSQWAGPLKTDESFECIQSFPQDPEFDLCSLFDVQTGQIPDTLRGREHIDRIFGSSLQMLSLRVQKKNASQVVPVIPVQLYLDHNSYELGTPEKGVHLSLEGRGALQTLACILDKTDSGNSLKYVQWKLDGKPLQAWSQPWLPPFLLTFGHEYSCSDGKKESPLFRYDATHVSIYGPSRAIVSHRTIQPALLKMEPSAFLIPEKTKWECQSSSQNLGCEIWGDSRNQFRHIHLFLKNDELLPDSAQVSVILTSGKSTLTRVVQVLSEHSNVAQSVDFSSNIEISELNKSRLLCSVKTSSQSDVKLSSISWYLNGKELAQFANRAEIPAPEVQKSETVACVVSANSTQQIPLIGIASHEVQPSVPLFAGLPDELLLDASSSGSLDFSILSTVRNLKSIDCTLSTRRGELLASNLCQRNSKNLEAKTSARKISRQVHFFMNHAELSSTAQKLVSESSQDLYALEPLLLNISLVAQGYASSRSVPVHLTLGNRRPEIRAAVTFPESTGEQVCAFLATDPENNHLSGTLNLGNEATAKSHSTTLDREHSAGEFTLFASDNRQQLPPFSLFGIVRSSSAKRILSKISNQKSTCEVLVSDGTLIATQTAREFKNSTEATRYLLEVARTLPFQKKLTRNPESISSTSDSPRTARVSNRPESGDLVSGKAFRSPPFSIVSLLAHSAGRIGITLSTSKQFVPEKIESCKGNLEICRQLFVSDGNLSLANTTALPSEHVFLALSNSQEDLVFILLEFVNTIYVPHASALSVPCAQQLWDIGNTSPHGPQESFFTARFAEGQELILPASLVARALSLGALDVFCHSLVRSIDSRVLSIKTSSLKESLNLNSLSSEQQYSVPIKQSSLASNQVLNLGGLFSVSPQNVRTLMPFFQDIQVMKCQLEWQILNSSIPCPTIPDDLSLSLPPTVVFPAKLKTQLKTQFLGQSYFLKAQALLSALESTSESLFLSVSLRPLANQNKSYVCVATGLDRAAESKSTSYRFRIFDGSRLIQEVTQTAATFEFQHERRLTDSSLLCEVIHGASAEIASFHETAAFEKTKSTCLALAKDGDVEMFPCKAPDDLDINNEKFVQSLKDSLGTKGIAKYAAFRIVVTSENAPFKVSQTWLSSDSADNSPDTSARTELVSPRAPPQAAYYLDEFRNRIICLFGFQANEKGSLPFKQTLDNLRGKNSFQNCNLLESIETPRSENSFHASDVVYFSHYPLSTNSDSPDKSKHFVPDAEIVVGESSAKTFTVHLLASHVRHLFESSPRCQLVCQGRSADGVKLCIDYAKKMLAQLSDTQCTLRPKETTDPPPLQDSLPLATLLVYTTASPQASIEYTATIAHFFSPTTEEQSP